MGRHGLGARSAASPARSVLILRRFDRADDGRRIGYISAMTALSAVDGEQHDYAEIAEAMRDLSLSPRADHRELFGCVVANVTLGNTDDHLCNQGLLAARRNGIREQEITMMEDSIEPRWTRRGVPRASREPSPIRVN
ncbi:MAG: HipA domain-containing protein [Galactobacter sp.]